MPRNDGHAANFKNNYHFGKLKYQRQFVDVRYLYDLSKYREHYCFVYHAEFFALNKAPHNAHCIKPKKVHLVP